MEDGKASEPLAEARRCSPRARLWATAAVFFAFIAVIAVGLGVGIILGGSSKSAPVDAVATVYMPLYLVRSGGGGGGGSGIRTRSLGPCGSRVRLSFRNVAHLPNLPP